MRFISMIIFMMLVLMILLRVVFIIQKIYQLIIFRREQVNLFIKSLSKAIRNYNTANNKRIQLGVSPSGIWKSGDGIVTYDTFGNAITNGSSTTSTYQHYGNYLYADTLRWINEEWIDYILPQTYWALEHGMCAYADLISWWDQVVKV